MTTEQTDEVDRIRATEPDTEPEAVQLPTEDLPALVLADRTYHPLPAYIADMARVLLVTEDHPDPTVRAIRKIAVQAIAALDQLLAEEPEDEPDDPDAAGWSFTDPQPANLPPSTRTIRAWARDNGLDVPERGPLSADVVQAYFEAQELAS
jgi:hypothetical protein